VFKNENPCSPIDFISVKKVAFGPSVQKLN